jgi:hypothetical protein
VLVASVTSCWLHCSPRAVKQHLGITTVVASILCSLNEGSANFVMRTAGSSLLFVSVKLWHNVNC